MIGAFTTSSTVMSACPDGTQVQVVVPLATFPSPSPDGTKIAYNKLKVIGSSAADGGIWISNADGTGAVHEGQERLAFHSACIREKRYHVLSPQFIAPAIAGGERDCGSGREGDGPMRTLYETALELTVVAVVALAVQGCASTGVTDPERGSRNQAGQTALEGMENSVLKDNNSDTPDRAKPPN